MNIDNEKEIVEALDLYNKAYRAGDPIVSDEEYDKLLYCLKTINPNNEFLNKVEEEQFNKNKVKHPVPMLSTEKAYTADALTKWKNRIKKACDNNGINVNDISFRITPKLDGLAARDDGFTVSSRGDGEWGFDITDCLVKGVIPFKGRGQGLGEIVINKSYFDKHLSHKYKHPRNVVVGIIGSDRVNGDFQKALDTNVIKLIPYDHLDNYLSTFNTLEKDVITFKTCVLPACEYPTDGIIVEVMDSYLREYLGNTNHHYRWMIACKDLGDKTTTTVTDITWQVGRTGNITPVLEVVPKTVSGAVIKRVTAHNAGFVKKKFIGIGAEVEIIRSGEVIPKLIMVIKPTDEVILPTHCPCCNNELSWKEDFLVCTNLMCSDQVERRMEHWFKTLEVDLFGPKTIKKILENRSKSIYDLIDFTQKDFMEIGFGEVQSKNLENELTNLKHIQIPSDKFLSAFGIDSLGKGISRRLMSIFTLDELLKASIDDLTNVNGISTKTAEDIFYGLKLWKEGIERFKTKLNIVDIVSQSSLPLTGKNIICSGTMDQPRHKIEHMIRQAGGNIQSTVNSKTDYLVVGDKPSTNKINKAKSLDVKIVDVNEFLKLI